MQTKGFVVAILAFLSINVFAGCEKKSQEGPAERAGKQVDKAMEQLADKAREVTDGVKDSKR